MSIVSKRRNILVTGGAGYIGSHTVRKLLQKGFNVVVVDNLSRGHKESLPDNIRLYVDDIKDSSRISEICAKEKIDAVIHFAAFIEVAESQKDPLKFYENNVRNTINLLAALNSAKVKTIIFSSTAAVFGNPDSIPIKEEARKDPINVYGRTKLMIETLLKDCTAKLDMNYGILRYFNAAGADDNGEIGEDHNPETHLIPIIIEAASGKREKILVFGTDYKTKDGSCVRDYIHVNDLADAHILTLQKILEEKRNFEFNLGSGTGYSVKEVIKTCEEVTAKSILVENAPRRPGDPAVLVADSTKIILELGWNPIYDLRDIISTAWKWHSKNPNGYAK